MLISSEGFEYCLPPHPNLVPIHREVIGRIGVEFSFILSGVIDILRQIMGWFWLFKMFSLHLLSTGNRPCHPGHGWLYDIDLCIYNILSLGARLLCSTTPETPNANNDMDFDVNGAPWCCMAGQPCPGSGQSQGGHETEVSIRLHF